MLARPCGFVQRVYDLYCDRGLDAVVAESLTDPVPWLPTD